MSTLPLPDDPYEALGLEKTCDADAIKKAHRKLVLKHHPDRIKDPTLIEHNKNEFQKVQQAYEMLIDPMRRQRYDDECKLAQLRKERMMSDGPRTTYTKTTYTARPAPPPSHPSQRDFQSEARYAYEERVPDSPYFESAPRGFEDPIPRANARKVDPKVDPYEKRSSTSKPAERKEKEKPKASGWERHGPAMKMAFAMKSKAEGAKMRVREREAKDAKDKQDRVDKLEKEKLDKSRIEKERARDREEARARDQKATNRRPQPFVEDESEESSDSDADTIRGPRRPPMRERSPAQKPRRTLTPEPPRSRRQASPYSEIRMSRQQSPRPMPRSAPQSSPRLDPRYAGQASPRPTRTLSPQPMRSDQRSAYDDEDESEDEKYERQFRHAQGYQNIAARKDPRPTPSRQGSDIRDYWQADTGRKSGSDDNDKQRSSSSQKPSRRSMPDEGRLRPPLPTQTSAPVGVRNAAATADDPRAKPRSRQNSYASSNHRREIPELKRSGSEPGPSKVPSKRDSVPVKGSSLKQTESAVNHDSGYGSSSSPQTPENRGDSPPRESRPRETSTKYSVKRDEDSLRARKMGGDDGDTSSQYLSPGNPQQHHRHHHRPESRERRSSRSGERESEARHRSGSNKPATSERRPSFSRNESSSRFEDREKPRNIRMEKSPDRGSYFRWEGEVRQTRPKAPTYTSSNAPNMSKFYEGSTVSRSAPLGRRPSVY